MIRSLINLLRLRLVYFSLAGSVLLGCFGAVDAQVPAKRRVQAARLGREFILKAGRQVTLRQERFRIKFAAVKEDSRCPADVKCIWAGNAAIQLVVSVGGSGGQSLALNTNGMSSLPGEGHYRGYKVRLVELSPYPRTSRKIAAKDYIATLLVTRE